MLYELYHFLLLLLQFLLLLFLFVLLALLGSHPLDPVLFFIALLAKLLKLSFLLGIALLFGLRVRRLLSVALALGSGSIAQLQAHNLVDDSEYHLQYFESLLHRLLRAANFDLGTHEDRVLVIDLLVRNVKFKQAVTMLLKSISNSLIDELVCDFFVLAKDNEVVSLGLLTGFFLVSRWFGHGQIVRADRE